MKSQIPNHKIQTNPKSQNPKPIGVSVPRFIWNLEIGNWKFRRGVRRGGFTLVEMLVVVGVFSLVAVLAGGLLMAGVRMQQRVSGGDQLVEEARSDMDALARRLRFGRIDYPWYRERQTSPADMLVFYAQDNQHIAVRRSPQLCFSATTVCLEMSVDDMLSWMPLTPRGVDVVDFGVYVSPSVDPFLKNADGAFVHAPEQPRVTLTTVFRAQGRGGRASEQITVPFQTSVTPRYYAR